MEVTIVCFKKRVAAMLYDDVGCAVIAVNVTVTGQKNRLFIIYFIAEFENDAEFSFFVQLSIYHKV